MSSSKSGGQLNVAFLGDAKSPLAADLGSHTSLTPFNSAAADTNALVIDGNSATAGAHTAAAVKTTLAAGKPVAIVSPTAEQIDSLTQLTGTQVTGQPDVVICLQGADVSGSPSYYTLVLSAQPDTSGLASESGSGAAPNSPTANMGASLAATLSTLTKPAPTGGSSPPSPAMVADVGSVSQLTPPLGATYGVTSFNYTLSSTWQWTEDKTARSGTQYFNSPMNVEFHVYYVDGEGGTPYYYVIVKLTGSFSPGSMLANNKNSIGFFQIGATLQAAAQNSNNQPFPSGVSLINHSPQNYNGDSVPVEIVLPMTLMVNSGGGQSPQQFTATEETSTDIADWAVQDQTSGSGPGWYYHQVGTWDPTVNPPNDFGDWWKQVYDGTGDDSQVKAMPGLSNSSLSFEALAAWRFDGSLLAAGSRSLMVHFNGSWGQSVGFLHNPDNCSDGGHHHLLSGGWGWSWGWAFDLGAVAVPTGQ